MFSSRYWMLKSIANDGNKFNSKRKTINTSTNYPTMSNAGKTAKASKKFNRLQHAFVLIFISQFNWHFFTRFVDRNGTINGEAERLMSAKRKKRKKIHAEIARNFFFVRTSKHFCLFWRFSFMAMFLPSRLHPLGLMPWKLQFGMLLMLRWEWHAKCWGWNMRYKIAHSKV